MEQSEITKPIFASEQISHELDFPDSPAQPHIEA
jgi:hypothetical protein